MRNGRASRLRRRRIRLRRWIARRRRSKPPLAQPPSFVRPQQPRVGPIEVNGIEFRPEDSGLELSTVDYHAGPAHLTVDDLTICGLVPAEGREDWPESVAKQWRLMASVQPDKARSGPALDDPRWRYPPGLQRGGFLVSRVRDGVDIFVLSFDAGRVILTNRDLVELGLSRAHWQPR